MNIGKGQIVVPTTDEHSDYTFLGIFHATTDFDTAEVLEQYLAAHPAQKDGYAFEVATFVQWALAKGLLESAGALEWHLASSGRLSQGQGVKELPIGLP